MYTMELMTVIRTDPPIAGGGITRTYYIRKCDVWCRVSEGEWKKVYESADGLSCAYTTVRGRYARHYRTLVWEGR